MSYITAYCHITEQELRVNGELKQQIDPEAESSWTRQLYKGMGIAYPKFYKMDRLSKLAFLGVEALVTAHPEIKNYGDDAIGLVFGNAVGSFETDERFAASYQIDEAPSPSMFVYTLPNILLGEITIRHKWYGESMFAVFPSFNHDFFRNYSAILMENGAEACLCGWVNTDKNAAEAFLFFIEKADTKSLNLPLVSLGTNDLMPFYGRQNQ